MNNKNLKIALDNLGKEYIKQLKDELENEGHDASGDLINSLKYKIVDKGNGKLELQIESVEYLEFIDKGRTSGLRLIPNDKLEKWTNDKGIKPNDNRTQKQLAWAINYSIQQNGIKPTGILKIVNDKMKNKSQDIIGQGVQKDLKSYVEDIFIDYLKK